MCATQSFVLITYYELFTSHESTMKFSAAHSTYLSITFHNINRKFTSGESRFAEISGNSNREPVTRFIEIKTINNAEIFLFNKHTLHKNAVLFLQRLSNYVNSFETYYYTSRRISASSRKLF